MRKLLGYQVANAEGENIQGDTGDPSGFASFEIMPLALADRIAAGNPGILLMPIFEGDIEEPTIIGQEDDHD